MKHYSSIELRNLINKNGYQKTKELLKGRLCLLISKNFDNQFDIKIIKNLSDKDIVELINQGVLIPIDDD